MQLSQVKKMLVAATLASGVAIAGLAVWAFWEPTVEIEGSGTIASGMPGSTPGVVTSAKPERDFSKLSGMLLRGPRAAEMATAPVETAPVIPTTPPFSIKLLGTIIDQGRALGLFQDAAGGFDVKAAGESLELVPNGVQIASIDVGKALVRYSGKEIDLKLDAGGIVTPPPQPQTQVPPMAEEGMFDSTPPAAMPPPAQPFAMPVMPSNSGVPADDIFAPLPANMDISNPANFGGVPTGNPNGQP